MGVGGAVIARSPFIHSYCALPRLGLPFRSSRVSSIGHRNVGRSSVHKLRVTPETHADT